MSEVRSPELAAAYAHCRAIAKEQAKNFYYSFVALPAHKSDAMCAVYAFMRKADDLADDESISLDARREAMAAWTGAWRSSREGESGDPVFLALNDTQRRFGISDELLEQLVAGTTLDLQPQPAGVAIHTLPDGRTVQVYESFAALQHYCYLVASVVGLVCIRIFGYSDRRAEQLAIDTGIAFQLTNILRDIKEDGERGRIYLPADLLAEHGTTPERVLVLCEGYAPQANELALLRGLELHAQTLYRSGYALIPLLEPDARPAMRVLIRIYHRLLDRIAVKHTAVFAERVSVPTTEKLTILSVGLVQIVCGKAAWMNEPLTTDVLVIGAGLAGLSAAVALSGAGADVTLLDRKPYVGGRAYSYAHPALDEVIDSQHVLLGCCTNLIDLCRHAGADGHIRWYDDITFLEPATLERATRRSVIGPSGLPAPGHSALSFLRAPMLSLADKTKIGLGLMEFLRGYPLTDEEPFSAWLKRTGQTERAILHFWEPVIVGALNDSFDRCSTRYAGQVFHESFMKSAAGGRLGIPTQPLSEFYSAVASLAEHQGTKMQLRTSIDRVERTPDGRWRAKASDGSDYVASKMILALPFEQTARLLGTLPEGDVHRLALLPLTEHFRHAPITTVHLWFDREITALDHAALLDTRIQWMFNKSRIRRDESAVVDWVGQYLELVISASFPELQQTREQILAPALEELARFFPGVREAKILKSGILKEARATFSVVPGLDRYRPEADAGSGLYLAGDWTRTGWPSTMEGAVRSGRLAAEAVARVGGSKSRFLSADLPAAGLMRLLV